MKLVRMILRLIYDGMNARASPTRQSEPMSRRAVNRPGCFGGHKKE